MDNSTAKVSCFARAYHFENNKTHIFSDSLAKKILGDDYERIAQSMMQGIDFFLPGFEGTKEDGLRLIDIPKSTRYLYVPEGAHAPEGLPGSGPAPGRKEVPVFTPEQLEPLLFGYRTPGQEAGAERNTDAERVTDTERNAAEQLLLRTLKPLRGIYFDEET